MLVYATQSSSNISSILQIRITDRPCMLHLIRQPVLSFIKIAQERDSAHKNPPGSSFLHSSYGAQNGDLENIPYKVLRTKSSGALNHFVNQPPPTPNPLSKTKSSTYISPQQSETLMYNTKVTLTLRRSQSRSNTELKKNYEDGKETLKRIQRNNSFNVEHRKTSMTENSEENKIYGRVREGYSPQETTPKHINRYYFGETPDLPEPISSPYNTSVTLAKKQSNETLNGPKGPQGYYHVPEVRNGAPQPPPLSSKPHLQQTVCSSFSKFHNKACYTNLDRKDLTSVPTWPHFTRTNCLFKPCQSISKANTPFIYHQWEGSVRPSLSKQYELVLAGPLTVCHLSLIPSPDIPRLLSGISLVSGNVLGGDGKFFQQFLSSKHFSHKSVAASLDHAMWIMHGFVRGGLQRISPSLNVNVKHCRADWLRKRRLNNRLMKKSQLTKWRESWPRMSFDIQIFILQTV